MKPWLSGCGCLLYVFGVLSVFWVLGVMVMAYEAWKAAIAPGSP